MDTKPIELKKKLPKSAQEVKDYIEGIDVLHHKNCLKDAISANENIDVALTEMDLGSFMEKVMTIFSDQVSCVCTKTGAPLFDLDRAKAIRSQLEDTFNALLETIDEEIQEYS